MIWKTKVSMIHYSKKTNNYEEEGKSVLWAKLNIYSTQFRKQLKNVCAKMLWNIMYVLRPHQVHVTKTNNTVKYASHFVLQRHHNLHYCTQLSPFCSKNKFCLIYIISKKKNSSNISLTFHEHILCVVQYGLVCELQVLPVSQ